MRRLIWTGLMFVVWSCLYASNPAVYGYIKDMQGYYYLAHPLQITPDQTFQWSTYNQVHNRLNINWQPTENLRFETGIRNRIITGKLIRDVAGYAGMINQDNGLVNLSWNLISQKNGFLNTSVDRIYVEYTWGQLQLRAGRQRINWGINLVWNPNDLFNAFSYIDFDYEERPGSDAVLLTWYSSASSNLDLAVKTTNTHNLTVATRYHFNLTNYDIQFIGGKNDQDWVLGGGWSGAVGQVSFRGEGTFFTPVNKTLPSSKKSLSASISGDYTFKNSLYVHTAFLYNSSGTTSTGSGVSILNPTLSLSAKHLSIGKYELFGQVSYPINPLFSVNVAGILNPSDGSGYLGPTCSYSVADNLDLMLTSQLLLGETGSEYGSLGNTYTVFGRIQWSF